MTTSKIKDITNVRPWNGKNGTVYYFSVVMENDDSGSVGKKSETALKVGDELTYTLESSEHGNKIKEIQQNNFGGGKNYNAKSNRGSNASFSLSYSKDLICALVAAGKTGDATSEQIAGMIVKYAGQFKTWLDANE